VTFSRKGWWIISARSRWDPRMDAYDGKLARLDTDLASEMKDFARWAADLQRGSLPRPVRGSDLDRDAELLRAFGAYPLLSGSHLSAANHMHAFCDSLAKANTVYAAASVTILRGALEPTALALWMVQPDDQNDRLRRALRAHYGSLSEYLKYKNATGATEAGGRIANHVEELRELAKEILGPETGVAGPNTTEVLRDIAGAGAEELWRLSSGIAHGLDWTKLTGFYVAAKRSSGAPTPDVHLLPDLDLIAQLTRTVHQLFESALTAYRARAGTLASPAVSG
jgi:hypothetical protein